MNARVEKRVEEWPARPFERGYSGLRDLADEEFSGVVEAGSTWLCMLNGSVVGVFDGDIGDFDDAEGTAYEAPHESVPLLFAMKERGGSLEEQYYTKDTPISEAVQTLSSGTFTGYVELSENVLSGDYYVLFHGGRSMNVAYVGSSERKDLVTDEEALDRADDEVGIYDVYSVDVDVVEIPGGDDQDAADTGGTQAEVGAAAAGSAADTAPGGDPVDESTNGDAATSDPDATTTADHEQEQATTADTGQATAGESGQATASDDPIAGDPAETTEYGSSTGTGESTSRRDPLSSDPSVRERHDSGESDSQSGGTAADNADPAGDHGGPADDHADPAGRADPAGSADERDRRTEHGDAAQSRSDDTTQPRSGNSERPREQTQRRDGRSGDADGRSPGGPGDGHGHGDRSDPPSHEGEARRTNRTRTPAPENVPDEAEVEELRAAIRDHEAAIDRLRDRLSGVEQDRDASEAERDRLRAEIDDLTTDLSDLRRTVLRVDENLDRLEERVSDRLDELAERSRTQNTTASSRSRPAPDHGADPEPDRRSTPERSQGASRDADRRSGTDDRAGGRPSTGAAGRGNDAGQFDRELTPEEAMTGSRVLVRYGSQGKPTLKSVHAGDAEQQAVNDNLRLDIHTNFEADGAGVEGEPVREWLTSRIEYRFAEWLVRELVYEIRDTGNADALADLYDAIPEIDHVELAGTVEIIEGDSEEAADAVNFDVVARDARGTPLVVANFNDDREPADQHMVVELQERAATLREHGPLTGAFLVTSSYFEATARETAEQATSGSLLSRDSKKSFVKLSRKRGFHLCLVESRDGDFHLNVPEL